MIVLFMMPALITTILSLIGLFVALAVYLSYGTKHSLARERVVQCLLFSAVFGAISLGIIAFI